MALINSNKPDSDGNLTGSIVRRLHSPSQSSVSSEELLVWSKEGNDYDWELFPISPPLGDELSRIQSSSNVGCGSSFTPVTYNNLNDVNNGSKTITITESNFSNSNSSSDTTIYSYNHNSVTDQLSTSFLTLESCSHYLNGSSIQPQLIHSTKTDMIETTPNELVPSSSFSRTLSSSSKKVTNHSVSFNNLYDQIDVNTLADDFIDLDIKTIATTSSCSLTTSYHPDFDYVGFPESPIQSLPNSASHKKLQLLNSFISNNGINIQKSNVVSQSPETEIIRQTLNPHFCHMLSSVSEMPTTKIIVGYNNDDGNNNDDSFTNYTDYRCNQNSYNKNNNSKSFHCQSSELIEHLLSSDNESSEDLPGYSFLSSSSASSCIHIPSTCNDDNHNGNNSCHDNHMENNTLSINTIHEIVNNEENANNCHHKYKNRQYQRQDNGLMSLTSCNSIPLPFMLIPTSELASGGSLTCTVVNILRCLGLLDRCGVEDLCAILYDFWNNNCHAPFHSFFKSHVIYPTCWELPRMEESVVTRSSSFTSCTLVDSRRSTVPGEDYERNYQMLINCRESKPLNGSCLVSYLLSCSYMGTSFLASHSIYNLNNLSSPCCLRPSTSCCYFVMDRTNQILPYNTPEIYHPNLIQPISNSNMNWRRGCADNLVLMLTHHSPGSKNSSSVVDKLLTGRFFPGPTSWRSVWPFIHINNPKYFNCTKPKSNMSDSLALWFSAWLYCGAIPVLAQLCDSAYSNAQYFPPDISQPSCNSSRYSAQELVWSHRLVYGVTENNEVYLTNPNELVPVQYVLDQLSKKPEIRISKAQISNLWTKHYLHSKLCPDRDQTIEDKQHIFCKSTFFTGESLTLLARHPDPRWASMNIMGQVLCALRSLERWADTLELSTVVSLDCVNHQSTLFPDTTPSISCSRTNSTEVEQFSNSPAIIIPSAQLPGISLFVEKSNWELVRTLLQTKA
ncbi:hypothetical protein MS3_00010315 [Schistosoma haematobium]|uniref:WW domain-containing protein n=1 Tax=Schistosoma haematobium TaxID=6185 RepID=A0A922S1S7_SCHHA|nr:hypothetical protein MS3_00010315 [Schistosoma haematobium]KAH9590076.1 hypothetical protein MS3_00010315 [Schistosoma haematobium]CAH8649871.1 unnamed protein product [Schistosoma haematobium]